MKKAVRVTGILFLLIIIVLSAIAAYVKFALPKVAPAPNIVVEKKAARIERGKYLANAVMACTDCHTERDWTKFAAPEKDDSLCAGSTLYDQKIGLPGRFHSKNITPYHLGNWTDGEIFRTITTGVNKDGKVLFPIMPYNNYGKLDKEDIYDVIAYLRTLPSVKKDIAPSEPDFPVNFLINTMSAKPAFTKKPDENNTIAYGRYLITAAGCQDCHSPAVKGEPVAGKEFSGGKEFNIMGNKVTTANLTPDETGLGNWTKTDFIARFKKYADPDYKAPTVAPTDFNTPMPWMNYAHMSEKDLGAIFDCLRTVHPVKNKVVKFERIKQG